MKEITLNVAAAEYMINNSTLQQENPALLSMYETKKQNYGAILEKLQNHRALNAFNVQKKTRLSEPENKLLRISFIFRA